MYQMAYSEAEVIFSQPKLLPSGLGGQNEVNASDFSPSCMPASILILRSHIELIRPILLRITRYTQTSQFPFISKLCLYFQLALSIALALQISNQNIHGHAPNGGRLWPAYIWKNHLSLM